jgi:hypothetical protein
MRPKKTFGEKPTTTQGKKHVLTHRVKFCRDIFQ